MIHEFTRTTGTLYPTLEAKLPEGDAQNLLFARRDDLIGREPIVDELVYVRFD